MEFIAHDRAFGDGSHPTTALLLEAMEGLAPGLRPGRVLDYGCGSGILALRAAQLWPGATLIAADSDKEAVRATRTNAQENGFLGRVYALRAQSPSDLAVREQGPYEVIVMNILAEPILALLRDVEAVLALEGVLLLSGILVWQEAPIRMAAEMLGLELAYRLTAGDWVALVLQKNAI
jgi:ribosomal protein L11 methyltransferase